MNTSTDLEITGDVAFFGPWVGEFGWELMSWQAWCRRQAKKFKKVYACSYPNMEYLYRDFAEFIPHGCQKRYLDWTNIEQIQIDYHVPEDVTQQIIPFKQYRLENQEFIKFGWPGDGKQLVKSDILIHARGGAKKERNYPVEKWEMLVEKLNEIIDSFGVIASIGTKDDLHIKGTTDCRGLSLEGDCKYISQAKMVIGQSSGAMHLASLCGTPHLVWGDSRTYFGETLEMRYKHTWNPLNTPVYWIYDDNWSPDPQILAKMIDNFLASLQVGQVPTIKTEPEPEKEMVPFPIELREKLKKALLSRKFFVTLSWHENEEKIEHFWLSRNFPDGDYQISLEHLMWELDRHFKEKKGNKDKDDKKIDAGELGWL